MSDGADDVVMQCEKLDVTVTRLPDGTVITRWREKIVVDQHKQYVMCSRRVTTDYIAERRTNLLTGMEEYRWDLNPDRPDPSAPVARPVRVRGHVSYTPHWIVPLDQLRYTTAEENRK